MALVKSVLQTELTALWTSSVSAADAAQKWADAMNTYAAAIEPISTTVALAATALSIDLQVIFSSLNSGTAIADLEQAFFNFAGVVGAGMAGTHVATPPILGTVGFITLFEGTYPDTQPEGILNFTNLIHDWLTTGTAVPNGGGPVEFWR